MSHTHHFSSVWAYANAGETTRQRITAYKAALVQEKAADGAALRQARIIAAEKHIDIEADGDDFWVTHPDYVDGPNDPLDGQHFCIGGREVLAAVRVLAEVLP